MSGEEAQPTGPSWWYPTLYAGKAHWFPGFGRKSGCGAYQLNSMQLAEKAIGSQPKCLKCERVEAAAR